MQKYKQIEEVFMKYSKPVIIQWLCTQYPIFFKDKKDIIEEWWEDGKFMKRT